MTINEGPQTAKKKEISAICKIHPIIDECEYRIEVIEKRLKQVRLQIKEAATRPGSDMYADNLEGLLRKWRCEYSKYLQEIHAHDLLGQAEDELA